MKKRQRNLVERITELVKSGKVPEEFKSSDFEFLSKSQGFIAKHAVGNGKYNEYFIRIERGKYKLK